MATKVQIKNEKYMPWGGIYFVIGEFLRYAHVIDGHLGLRSQTVGYQYSEICAAMLCNFSCGGDRTEDINTIREQIKYKPGLRLCSPDTVLRGLSELAVDDITYTSEKGVAYRFNTADRLNGLLMKMAVATGMVVRGREYDFDYDNEYLASETYDAIQTYKGMRGYSPGCAVLTDPATGQDCIVGIENRDGNAAVKFHQEDTMERILLNVFEPGTRIRHARVDCGSYCEKVIDLLLAHSRKIFVRAEMSPSLRSRLQEPQAWRKTEVNGQRMEVTSVAFDGFGGKYVNLRLVVQRQRKEGELDLFDECGQDDGYVYRAILTNEKRMTEEEVIDFYNQRGAKEKVFDQMDNDFGWHYLPKSLLKENTVFLLLTAMLRNFYRWLLQNEALRAFGIYCTTRMKAFTAKVVTVVAKWTRGGRRDFLNLYTPHVEAYQALYADYG